MFMNFVCFVCCVESTTAYVSDLLHPTLRDNVVECAIIYTAKLLALPSKIFLLYELKILKLCITGLLLVTIF